MVQVKYNISRELFYNEINDFWPNMYGSEYSLYAHLPVNEDLIVEIRTATKLLGSIFFKIAKLIRELDDDSLIELGFAKEILDYLKSKPIFPETIISRFDFVNSTDGLKLLEFNSDTPTFIKECYVINNLICDHFKVESPNNNFEKELKSAVNKAIIESLKYLNVDDRPNIVFTAHEDNIEDWLTSKYIKSLCDFNSEIVNISELRINEHGLFDTRGERIDILYRQTYPIEYLVDDIDKNSNTKVGLQLLELVNQKKLAIINPLTAFTLQPKTIQALIWGLAEQGKYFSNEEVKTILNYMLPTYLERDNFTNKMSYVKKPSLGREGDTVTIFSKNNEVINKNSYETYESEIPVYQKYIELPEVELETEKGKENLSYIFGSFLIAGRPGAIGVRAGAKITANDSYFLPISIIKNNNKGVQ
jgi:glutathionylspermidine synthase